TMLGYRGDDGPGGMYRAHLFNLTTGEDRTLPGPPGLAQHGPFFLPDGRHVIYMRDYPGPANAVTGPGVPAWTSQLVVAPVDGSGPGLGMGPRAPFGQDGPTINNELVTPDGLAVIANYDAEQVARILPIDGSPGSVLIHGQLALPGYQRLAP